MKDTHRIRKMRKRSLYSNNDVPAGFWYWKQRLLNYCLGIFQWEGLPESLPARELEANLLLTGHAVVIEGKDGPVCPVTELYGYDLYYRPTKASFGNPLLPFKNIELGKNGAVIFNDRLQGNILTEQITDCGLSTFIARYARQLADMESSIASYIINTRIRDYLVASDQSAADRIKDFQDRIDLGERAVLTDDDILGGIRTLQRSGTLPDDLNSLLIARDKILSCFFRDIGVKFLESQKRAQMTEDEVQADEQMLLINVADMLQEREEGAERVNRLFGLLIKPRINPAFDRGTYQEKEGRKNDDQESI